jgi:hypothetical protein
VGAALLTLLAASAAHAEPSAADKETARRLMTEGRAHRKDGDNKAALQSFIAADAIMHVPTTGLEVARTEVDLGQLVEARDQLLAIARLPNSDKEPRAFSEARETAKALGAEIEPRIPSVRVKVQGAPSGAAVKVVVDGAEIPSVALTAPRAVDPGHHVIAASAGAEPHQVEVDVAEGETKDVTVDLGAATADGNAPPPAGGKSGEGTDPVRLASYIGFGVGGAGLILGAVTGILAISKLSAAKQQGCVGNDCPPAADSDLNSASTMATLSTVGFVVGGVGVAGGVTAFLLSRHSTPADSHAAAPSVSFYFGPSAAGLRGTF